MQIRLRYNLLAAGLLLLLVCRLLPASQSLQTTFLLATVFFLGIPHGALDIQLQQRMRGANSSGKIFLLRYLLFIILYALIWFKFPVLSFFIFLGITAYHFGEVDWPALRKSSLHAVIASVSGFFWILFILCWHMKEAAAICELLVNNVIPAGIFLMVSAKLRLAVLLLLLLWLVSIIIFPYWLFRTRKAARLYVFQTVVLLLMNLLLPLWIFFAFYFGIWHSMLSFDLMRKSFLLPWHRSSIGVLFRKALPYTFPVWLLIAGMYFFILASWSDASLYYIIFLVVAILTFPHLLVFSRLRMFLK